MRSRGARTGPAGLLIACGGLGLACQTTVYDYGTGPEDAKGRSVEELERPTVGDLDRQTESRAEATEEEAIEDVIRDSER